MDPLADLSPACHELLCLFAGLRAAALASMQDQCTNRICCQGHISIKLLRLTQLIVMLTLVDIRCHAIGHVFEAVQVVSKRNCNYDYGLEHNLLWISRGHPLLELITYESFGFQRTPKDTYRSHCLDSYISAWMGVSFALLETQDRRGQNNKLPAPLRTARTPNPIRAMGWLLI